MIKTIAFALSGFAATAAGILLATTWDTGRLSVVVQAGQTIEIPLSSTEPVASDLAAKGTFESGDVTFTAGPGCSLSAHHCTLMVTAAPSSKGYAEVPVTVTEAAGTGTATFALSVLRAGDSVATGPKLTGTFSKPLKLSRKAGSRATVPQPTSNPLPAETPNRQEEPVQRSGNTLFYAEAKPRPGMDPTKIKATRFTPEINGPSYQVVELTNRDAAQSLSVTITGSGAKFFTLDNKADHFGANKNCASLARISSGDSCLVIIKGEVGDPSKAPEIATLTLRGEGRNVASFELRDTTYVYAAGGFNTLGDANVSGGNLLAQCTAGTCSNALQGSTGNNYSTANFSVGSWINALAVTTAGNIMVGGVFGAIGGATSGASSGTAALLAQCAPGSVSGNACINQVSGASNNYAFNNAYIDGITAPFVISASNFMAVAGDFANIRGFSVPSGKMPAKCAYNGTSSTPTCNTYLTGASTKYASDTIVAVNTVGSSSGAPLVHFGGLFTQIGAYPASAPSSGTTFASCSTSACSKSMGSDNPNNAVLAMADDGTNLYMGGAFTSIGGYADSGGGYPLVSCTPAATTTCANALSGSNDANSYIRGLTYSGSSLYVGGKFTTIGGATPTSGPMLAVCTPGGTCSNFITDTNPYASGSDWGAIISGLAVGTQTGIRAN